MNRGKHLALKIWQGWLRDIIIILAIMTPLRSSIADWNLVPTGSMKPTILEGDRVFVNKLAYDLKIPLTTWHLAEWSNPSRGDIVVFFSPTDQTRLVKRVIGLPGDIIELQNNRLLINGEPADYRPLDQKFTVSLPEREHTSHIFAMESFEGLHHAVMATPSKPAMRSFGPVVIPENSYVMLGDNRDNSADSRYFGFVHRNNIVGKASAVVISLDRNNFYFPRMNRWFKKLS